MILQRVENIHGGLWMVDKYQNFEALEDDREFCFGDVWKVRDELISFPRADRVEGKRNIHFCRLVLITQNCDENNNKYSPIIQVAPLSTTVQFQGKFDILLHKNIDIFDTNAEQSMIELQLEQPMLKKDLFEKVGYISEEKMYEIIALKSELMGLDLNEEDILEEN